MTALSGGLEIQVLGYAENTKRSKKLQALRMTFYGELEMQKTNVVSDFYCLPNKLALMG
jgi:hypothetical protein